MPSLRIGRVAVLALAGCAPATAGSTGEGANARPDIPDAPSSTVEASLVFDGVTVVDVEQGKLIPDQRVVITGNRIQTVGDAAAVTVPQDARVVAARGKYLIPGLWDLHAHSTDVRHGYWLNVHYPLLIANGVTGIRDAGSVWSTDSLVAWRQKVLSGALVGPPRQLFQGQRQDMRRDQVRTYEDMAYRKAHGANFLKLYGYTHARAAAARRTGLLFGGHVYGDPIAASDSGITILDHAMLGGLPERCLGNRVEITASVEKCHPIAERFQQNNTWWVPTIIRNYKVWSGNWKSAWNPGAASGAVGGRLSEVVRQFWSGVLPTSRWLHDVVNVEVSPTDSVLYLSIPDSVGLPILAGTDGAGGTSPRMNKDMISGFSLHAELAIYVIEGLSPLEALRTATLNPATMLQGTDSLGTVAPGKLADVVLLDADPLASIANITTIRAVVANGRYFDRAALDKLLVDVQAKRP